MHGFKESIIYWDICRTFTFTNSYSNTGGQYLLLWLSFYLTYWTFGIIFKLCSCLLRGEKCFRAVAQKRQDRGVLSKIQFCLYQGCIIFWCQYEALVFQLLRVVGLFACHLIVVFAPEILSAKLQCMKAFLVPTLNSLWAGLAWFHD